jgi:aminoglycoside 2'-N-acetyltransferase I
MVGEARLGRGDVGRTELLTLHTADLWPGAVGEIRALLVEAFAGDIDESDVEHCLGGVHAVVREDRALVAHGAVVMRRLLHGGRALRCGYVEGLAVRSDRRRRGHGDAVMAALERIVRGAYDLGALGASDAGAALYASRGWRRWTGATSVLAPDGLRRTPDDDDAVHVLPVTARLDLDGDLACDWREGEVW